MNKGYTQSNKKTEMAAKMGLKMNGPGKTDSRGMKFRGNGKQGTAEAMKVRMQGKAKGSLQQKPTGVNTNRNPVGKGIYTQAGNEN